MTLNSSASRTCRGNFEHKSIVSGISGPKVSEFGTVRPRGQIPGPRPISEYDPGVTANAAMAMDHSWITIFPDLYEAQFSELSRRPVAARGGRRLSRWFRPLSETG